MVINGKSVGVWAIKNELYRHLKAELSPSMFFLSVEPHSEMAILQIDLLFAQIDNKLFSGPLFHVYKQSYFMPFLQMKILSYFKTVCNR